MRAMRLAVTAGALGVLLAAAPALAQDAPDLARAEQVFRQALADEQAGQCERAIAELTEARSLAHEETPQLLFHLGACHGRLGRVVLARDELRSALQGARAQGLENVAATARALLDATQARIATLTLGAPGAAGGPGTRVTVDGVDATGKLGTGLELDPGDHTVDVAFASGSPAQLRVTLKDGERRELPLPEPPAPAAVTPPPAPPAGRTPSVPGTSQPVDAPAPAAPAPGRSTPLAWVLLGSGAAALAGGGVFWALRDGTISTLDGECSSTRQACPGSARTEVDHGKTYTVVADVLFAAGGAAVAAGAGFLLFGGHGGSTTGVRLAPVLSPRVAGLGIAGAL